MSPFRLPPPASFSAAAVAMVVGFGGTVALIVQAGQALGASPAQIISMVTALCLGIGLPGDDAGSQPGIHALKGVVGSSLGVGREMVRSHHDDCGWGLGEYAICHDAIVGRSTARQKSTYWAKC